MAPVRYTFLLLLIAWVHGAFAEGPRARRRAPSSSEGPSATSSSDPAQDNWDGIRNLQLHLDNVASGTRRNRYLLGGAFIGGSAFLSGVYIAQDRLGAGEPQHIAKGVVGTTGLLFAAGGILTLLLPGESESMADSYRAMRPKSVLQQREKERLGEAELRNLADLSRTSRSIVGGGFLAVGAADLIWFLGTGPATSLNFLPYLAGLYGGFGLFLVTVKSPAEFEYEEYEREQSERHRSTVQADWSLTPLARGLALGMTLRF